MQNVRFVFEGFVPGYSDGLAFAIAETIEEAKSLIEPNGNCYDWGILIVHNLDEKVAYSVCGGA